MKSIQLLQDEIKSCQICIDFLPMGPNPVVQIHPDARILIVGQAPGKKVHDTGIPFNDASGDRLREWLAVSKSEFYNPEIFAIVPMGFCYPGKGKSGDLPPRKECVTHWREKILSRLTNIQLTLVIGQYAMSYHLPESDRNLTATVANWQEYKPNLFPLPHPSPRNNIWLKRNPWFEEQVIPSLQSQVMLAMNDQGASIVKS